MDHESIWLAAIEHAGLSAVADELELISLDGLTPASGQGGFYLRAGTPAVARPGDPLEPHVARLNRRIDKDRVVLWNGDPELVVAALMRHELEHICQFRRFGPGVFRLHEVIKEGLFEQMATGIGGAFLLVNAAPLEFDANAAAARFVFSRFPAREIQEMANETAVFHQVLFRYSGPAPNELSLPQRIVTFGTLFAEACEAASARAGVTLAATLESAYVGAGEMWTATMGDRGD